MSVIIKEFSRIIEDDYLLAGLETSREHVVACYQVFKEAGRFRSLNLLYEYQAGHSGRSRNGLDPIN
jgi:hypothetical protein